jgi:hypothetical protein
LSIANAALGEKDLALKEAERAIMLEPRAQDAISGPGFEENLALIQTIFGENSRAIPTLTQLLQTPYMEGGLRNADYAGTFKIRPALGSFTRRSRFPKTLRGKEAVNPRSLARLTLLAIALRAFDLLR